MDEAKELLNVLLQYLPFSGKTTQIMISSRYSFSLEEQERDLVKERLEWINLTSFPESEQRKKARELENVFYYADQSLVSQLVAAGHGNPRLMEWLDVLVGQMEAAEVPQMLEAISGNQEEFIREHVIRELLQRGGDELTLFLRWFGIYRKPVLIDGVQQVGENAGLEPWKELLQEGIGLSLIEYDQARENYQLTPLLREEHPNVAFRLNNLGEAWRALGEPKKAIGYYEQALIIFKDVYGETHQNVATTLNNIGLAWKALGKTWEAISYYEQALTIDRKVYGHEHPDVARDLNNLGAIYLKLGQREKAKAYLEEAYAIFEKYLGPNHPSSKKTAGWLEKCR